MESLRPSWATEQDTAPNGGGEAGRGAEGGAGGAGGTGGGEKEKNAKYGELKFHSTAEKSNSFTIKTPLV